MNIVGVDCATDPKKVGIACGTYDQTLKIHSARTALNRADLVDTVSEWLLMSDNALLALDAPLGWPASLGSSLTSHSAGELIRADANSMFRRDTDIEIKRRLNQQPLDVGADRIARTALSTLGILESIKLKVPMSMGWNCGDVRGRQFIEVYPAATLKALEVQNTGYKKKEQSEQREAILSSLALECTDTTRKAACDNDDVLDAMICVLAGLHFVQGKCTPPTNAVLAQKEGWIWARNKVEPPK